MDTSMIHRVEDVPFVRHSGVTIVGQGFGWAITGLEQQEAHTSHAGTFQGAALYAVAEVAMSVVLAGLMESHLHSTLLTVSDATVSFSRPASGKVTAHATLSELPERILLRVARDGATALAVVVRIRDASGAEVGAAEFACRISRRLDAV